MKTWAVLFVLGLTSLGSLAAQVSGLAALVAETTPVTLDGAETFVYRDGKPDPMRLHVFKPGGWKPGIKLPALIWFFGGGWVRGTPDKSAGWARLAAQWGMVGIAPDYRTQLRFGTSPLESVADARASLRWVEDHALELGIDPAKIVVGGNSAGGHLALWTAIGKTPPGSRAEEAPGVKPAALILLSAPSDTSLSAADPANPAATRKIKDRFGEYADALSPLQSCDTKMPPMLVIHGDADPTVPYQQSVNLMKVLTDGGNFVEFVSVPGGTHNTSDAPGWKERTRQLAWEFLKKLNVIPSL